MAFDKFKRAIGTLRDEVGRIKQAEKVASRSGRMRECLKEIADITAEQKRMRERARSLRVEHDTLKAEIKALRRG